MSKNHKEKNDGIKVFKNRRLNTLSYKCPSCPTETGEVQKSSCINNCYKLSINYINEYHRMINNILHTKYPEYPKLLLPEFPDLVTPLIEVVQENDAKVKRSRIFNDTVLVEEISDYESEGETLNSSPRSEKKKHKSRIPVLLNSPKKPPDTNPNYVNQTNGGKHKKENNVIKIPTKIVNNGDKGLLENDYYPTTNEEFIQFIISSLNSVRLPSANSESSINLEDLKKTGLFDKIKSYILRNRHETKENKKNNDNLEMNNRENNNNKMSSINYTSQNISEKLLNIHNLDTAPINTIPQHNYQCFVATNQENNIFSQNERFDNMMTPIFEESPSDISVHNYLKNHSHEQTIDKNYRKIISSNILDVDSDIYIENFLRYKCKELSSSSLDGDNIFLNEETKRRQTNNSSIDVNQRDGTEVPDIKRQAENLFTKGSEETSLLDNKAHFKKVYNSYSRGEISNSSLNIDIDNTINFLKNRNNDEGMMSDEVSLLDIIKVSRSDEKRENKQLIYDDSSLDPDAEILLNQLASMKNNCQEKENNLSSLSKESLTQEIENFLLTLNLAKRKDYANVTLTKSETQNLVNANSKSCELDEKLLDICERFLITNNKANIDDTETEVEKKKENMKPINNFDESNDTCKESFLNSITDYGELNFSEKRGATNPPMKTESSFEISEENFIKNLSEQAQPFNHEKRKLRKKLNKSYLDIYNVNCLSTINENDRP